ncbi:MAG TPA: plastocyanin/azurin family copper-binding protein [Longimicrobium sp.]
MQPRNLMALAALGATLLAACGGEKGGDAGAPADTAQPAAAPAAAPAPATGSGPTALGEQEEANGTVIEVKMITDDTGNRFEPNVINAKEGDVLRFTLATGVHNVDFLAAKNPGVNGLPAPSEMLQLPGQTKEYVVGLKAGSYYFQCDPHAALGMTGTLNVTAD